MKKFSLVVLVCLSLAACQAPQLPTSEVPSYLERQGLKPSPTGKDLTFEERLAKVAQAQKELTFPARIGLARLESSNPYSATNVTTIAPSELEQWLAARNKSPIYYGAFLVLDPTAVKLATSAAGSPALNQQDDAIATLRLAGAQKHLDAVLVYEMNYESLSQNRGFWLLDLVTLGILPTRTSMVQTTVTAALIDVATDYPYASTDVVTVKESTYARTNVVNDLQEKATQKAVAQLVPKV